MKISQTKFIYITLLITVLLSGFNKPAYAEPDASNPANGKLTVKILTLNLHGGRDEKGRDNLAKTRQLIAAEQPDLVLLQEVLPHQARSLQTAGFHSGLGMNLNFLAYHFGNAILTKHKVIYHRHFYLPGNLEQRGMDEMVLEIAGRFLMIVNTHLGLGVNERRRQLAEILRVLGYFQGPVVICGDFNTQPDDPLFEPLRDSFEEIGTLVPLSGTFPASAPRERLDQIWYNQNWQPKQAGVLLWDGSDHLPLAAELELTDPLSTAAVPTEVPEPPQSNTPLLPEVGRNDTRLEFQATHAATGNEIHGAVTFPVTGNLSVTGRYSESGLSCGLSYRLAAFDLRDYLSLWRNIRGKGEWVISCGMAPGRPTRFNLEQSYRWNDRSATRIYVGAPDPTAGATDSLSCRLEQTLLASDHLGWSLGLGTNRDYSLGIAFAPDTRQTYQLLWRSRNNDRYYELTWRWRH